ncbi:MAG TPA: J domain-containing protein [Ktedonobacterales bacterium]|nr:J domain-containing protein [Ktedonobacterales bacterium]HEX5571506.1 J domain-containing protein [Ktedonobacterales bacterium]
MAETDNFDQTDHTDYYALLGVSPGSQPDEITQAFHQLARQNHPDLHPGDAAADQRFKDINTAYQTLSDPERRAEYNRQRASATPLAGAPVAASGEGPEVITFERSIDLGGNADIQAVVEELRTAVTGMAEEAADELRAALLNFGVEVNNIAQSAGRAASQTPNQASEQTADDGAPASPRRGNRAQRRAGPPHGGMPPHGGQPPKRRPGR